MSSSESDSEDEAAKRMRQELLSCVVSADQVRKEASVPSKRRRSSATDEDGLTMGGSSSGKINPTEFELHVGRKLMAYLSATFEPLLQQGVWDVLIWAPLPTSRLRLFLESSTLQKHEPPAGDQMGHGDAGVKNVERDSSLQKSDGETAKSKAERDRKAERKAERRADRKSDRKSDRKEDRKADRKAQRKAERKAEKKSERERLRKP